VWNVVKPGPWPEPGLLHETRVRALLYLGAALIDMLVFRFAAVDNKVVNICTARHCYSRVEDTKYTRHS
jgi:hypothetical protein